MQKLFARLLGASALSAAPAATAADGAQPPAPAAGTAPGGDQLSEERIEAALQAAKAEGVTEGTEAGAKAERERTAAVFASEAGKKNMAMAAWMLSANPTATAESIVSQLATMPEQAQPAAAAPKVTAPLAETPKVDLTDGKPAGAANDGAVGDDSAAVWDGVMKAEQERYLGSATNPSSLVAAASRTGF